MDTFPVEKEDAESDTNEQGKVNRPFRLDQTGFEVGYKRTECAPRLGYLRRAQQGGDIC